MSAALIAAGVFTLVLLGTVASSFLFLRWRSVVVPPFRALLIARYAGPPQLARTGSVFVSPGSTTQEIDPALRQTTWQTKPGGELVLADGHRLAVALRLWFQVPLEAEAAQRSIEMLGRRLDPDQVDALSQLLGAPVQGAVATLSRHWRTDPLPPTVKVRKELLDRIDEAFAPLGLVASDVEILRLEVVA